MLGMNLRGDKKHWKVFEGVFCFELKRRMHYDLFMIGVFHHHGLRKAENLERDTTNIHHLEFGDSKYR